MVEAVDIEFGPKDLDDLGRNAARTPDGKDLLQYTLRNVKFRDEDLSVIKSSYDEESLFEAERQRTGQEPPSRGVVGEVLHSGGRAITDSIPMGVAQTIRGGNVGSVPVLDRFIDEQIQDLESDPRSREFLKGSETRRSIVQGIEGGAQSLPISLGGFAAGVGAGALTPADPATKLAVGTGTAMAAAGGLMYRYGKDEFVSQIVDSLKQRYNVKPEQIEGIKQEIEADAVKSGLAEAGPEMLSEGFEYLLFRAPIGKAITGLLGQTASKKILNNTLTKVGAKYASMLAAEIPSEAGTEVLQSKIRSESKYAPPGSKPVTFSEALKEVAGPTAVTTAMLGGGMGMINRLAGVSVPAPDGGRITRDEAIDNLVKADADGSDISGVEKTDVAQALGITEDDINSIKEKKAFQVYGRPSTAEEAAEIFKAAPRQPAEASAEVFEREGDSVSRGFRERQGVIDRTNLDAEAEIDRNRAVRDEYSKNPPGKIDAELRAKREADQKANLDWVKKEVDSIRYRIGAKPINWKKVAEDYGINDENTEPIPDRSEYWAKVREKWGLDDEGVQEMVDAHQDDLDRVNEIMAEMKAASRAATETPEPTVAPTIPPAEQPPAEPAPQAKAKEPWEMTREEVMAIDGDPLVKTLDERLTNKYDQLQRNNKSNKPLKRGVSKEIKKQIDGIEEQISKKEAEHIAAIQQAISGGLPVPPEVLKDYPELAGKAEPKQVHDHSSTQVDLDGDTGEAVRGFAAKIPDDEIHTDPNDPSYGREGEPHVTVKYGLKTSNPKDIGKVVAGFGPIKAKFGKVSIFKNDDYDVVKVDIESDDLKKLNAIIADKAEIDLPEGETFGYSAHATIAYVKPGEGEKYVGSKDFDGKEIEASEITLIAKDGTKHKVSLIGKPEPVPTKPQPPSTPAQAASDQRGSTISKGLVGEAGATGAKKAKGGKKEAKPQQNAAGGELQQELFRTPTANKPKLQKGKGSGVTAKAQTEVFTRLARGWKNAPKHVALETQDQLPDGIQAAMKDGDTVQGVYWRGAVYTVGENLSSADEVAKAIMHESLGHYGLRLLGNKADTLLKGVYGAKRGQIQTVAKEYGFDVGTEHGRLMAADEWLAREAAKGDKSSWVDRAVRIVRNWLRNLGFKVELSDTEIRAWLGDMRKAVEKGPDGELLGVREAAFSKTTSEGFEAELFGRTTQPLSETIKEKLEQIRTKEWWDGVNTKLIDKLHPVKQLGDRVYQLYRIETGIQAPYAMMLLHGMIRRIGDVFTTDTKNKGFINTLQENGGKGTLYWIAAKRAEVLEGQGRENWLTKDRRDKIFAKYGASNDPTRTAQAKEINKWFKSVLDIAEADGLIDPATRKDWEQDFYLPFYRIFEDKNLREEFLFGPSKGKRVISSGIRRLEGKDAKIGDPLENTLANWMHLLNESQRNRSRQAAFESATARGLARLVKKIPKKNLYFEMVEEDGKPKRRFLTKEEADRVLTFQKNGKPVSFTVDDPHLFQALAGMDAERFDNMIMKFLRTSKRWLTYGATFGVAFRIANPIRDTMQMALLDKSFTPFVDTAKGFYKSLIEDDDYVKFMAAMGGFGSSYADADSPGSAARFIKRTLKGQDKTAAQRILDTPKKALAFWEKVGAASENATRLMVWKNALEQGKTDLEAAFAARDVLDFHKSGAAGAVQFLIQTIPFLNPRIQGLVRVGEGALDPKNRMNFIKRAAGLTAASIALWFAYKDDDRYKELEDWDKWAYYHFWVGDEHFRSPNPFEVGAILSAFPVAVMDVLYGNEKTKHIADFLGHTATQTFAIGLPQAISPAVEQWANRSFFTGRPIVGERLKNLKPSEQREPWTSETLQVIGDALNISPKRAESLVNGYFSTFGMFILGGSDILMSHLFDFPVAPAMGVGDVPGLGRFWKDVPVHTKQLTWFYDFARETDQFAATINHYRNIGDLDKARKLASEESEKLKFRKSINRVRRTLTAINKQTRGVYENNNLSAKEKKERLDALLKRRNEIVAKAYKTIGY